MTTTQRFFHAPESSYFLFGPRGTGKSTWLGEIYRDALWIDLLAPEVQRIYASRPERLRDVLPPQGEVLVVIDEVQKIPELLSVVHQLIENRRPRPRFVLTGSSARKLKRTGVDLLAGRALLKHLHPFMAAELGDRFNLERALRLGTLPLVEMNENPEEALKAYVGLYLHEEVQLEGAVRDLGAFARFLEATSFSHAGLLNVTDIARDCQVSRTTVEGYFGVLEDLLLAFRVPVFRRRAKRQITTRPKFYWFDSGVFRSIRPTGPLDRPEEIGGAALEGLVAQHLRAWNDYSGGDHQLSFWRTRNGLEVDFIIYGPMGFWALEIKHATSFRKKDLRSLKAFQEDYPEAQPIFLYRGHESLFIDGISCLPIDRFLLEILPERPLPIALQKD